MTDGSLLPDQTVLIEGIRIVAVRQSDDVRISKCVEVLDAAGGYLIPGLWDMHVHSVREPAADREEVSRYGDTAGPVAYVLHLDPV